MPSSVVRWLLQLGLLGWGGTSWGCRGGVTQKHSLSCIRLEEGVAPMALHRVLQLTVLAQALQLQ